MKIKIYANQNKDCEKIKKELISKLKKAKFIFDEKDPDLVIAIGGDGAFLRMVKKEHYNTKPYYVGINGGTLGFLQNINKNELDDFIFRLKNKDYDVEEISIQETNVKTKKEIKTFYALNEIVIREKELNVLRVSVYIDKVFLENYVGDGLLISTSTGSTAYNLSFDGSIVYNIFHTSQITPIAPLNNGSYRNIINSIIIPEDMLIRLEPNKVNNELLFTVDGFNIPVSEVKSVQIKASNKKLKCLRLNDYHFIKTVNEKFLNK